MENKIIFSIKVGGELLYWVKNNDKNYVVYKKNDENFSKTFNNLEKCLFYILDDWIFWNYLEKDKKQIEIKTNTSNILCVFNAIGIHME